MKALLGEGGDHDRQHVLYVIWWRTPCGIWKGAPPSESLWRQSGRRMRVDRNGVVAPAKGNLDEASCFKSNPMLYKYW